MRILAVQNEKKALDGLAACIRSRQPDDELLCLDSSPAALAAAREKEIDVAFLQTDLAEMNGLLLGEYLKELNPFINLIFLTGAKDEAFDAMQLRASGCLLFPVSDEAVRTELSELRYRPDQKNNRRIFAQTFGNFDLFIDGKPVAFKYSKTKEIVALLINNRGAQTTNGEIIASLWEDDGDPEKKSSYLSNLRQDLQNTLTKLKAKDIILKQRGSMAIAKDRIECDLYDWLEKKKESRYQYLGDYMNQYSWAEYIHAELDEISYSFDDE